MCFFLGFLHPFGFHSYGDVGGAFILPIEDCMYDWNFFLVEIRWGVCHWKLPWGSQSAYTEMSGTEFCSELMRAIVLITSFFECQVFFLVWLFYLLLFFECVDAMVIDIVCWRGERIFHLSYNTLLNIKSYIVALLFPLSRI